MVAALELKAGELVVEIGAGHGELTFELAKYPVKIIATEKDKTLARELAKRFQISNSKSQINSKNQPPRIQIVADDILKTLPQLTRDLMPGAWKLIGNIPYYLTGYLLRLIGGLENKPSLIVFTIQKEVAERICAQLPRMNLLAASIQIWAEPEIIDYLPAKDFSPPPKVEAAILKLRIRNKELGIREIDLENYYKFIKIIFKQPRKTVLNNLAEGLRMTKKEVAEILSKVGLTGQERGQDLSIDKLYNLSKWGQL